MNIIFPTLLLFFDDGRHCIYFPILAQRRIKLPKCEYKIVLYSIFFNASVVTKVTSLLFSVKRFYSEGDCHLSWLCSEMILVYLD